MKKYLITGLLIWIPLVITIWVLKVIFDALDQSLLLLPIELRTESWLGVHIPGARWLWVATGFGAVAAVLVFAIPQLVSVALKPVRALKRPWLDERAQRLEDAVIKFRKAPSALGGAFVGALVVQVTIVAFYLLTAEGLSVPLPMFLGAVLIPVSLVVQMAPVSINGFGVREAVFAFFFRRFGLPTDAAVALSLVSTGMVMGLSLVGGFFFLRRR